MLDKTIHTLTWRNGFTSMQQNNVFPIWKFCVCMRVRDFALVAMFLQDGAQEKQHSKTKQESAWLFRLWYTFDHKYPFYPSVQHQKFCLLQFQCCRVGKVLLQQQQQLRLHSCPSSAIKAPVKCAVVGGWGPESHTHIHETSLRTLVLVTTPWE